MATTVLSLQDAHAVLLDFILQTEDWLGRYTHVEVWRSTLGEEGPYTPLFSTTSTPQMAVVPDGVGDPSDAPGGFVEVFGKPLELRVNRSYTLAFTSTETDPISKADWAASIQAAIPSIRAWVDSTGCLGLASSDAYGSTGSLEILPGDAATLLGLTASIAFGRDDRILIPAGCTRLSYRDLFGKNEYYYKVRFFDRFTKSVSVFSPPIQGGNRLAGVQSSMFVRGYVKLMSGGVPTPHTRISVYYPNAPALVDGYLSVGQNTVQTTDDNGYAEFLVLRGVPMDVAVAGSNTVRRVTIPVDVPIDSFNLFDPALANDDAFGVQRRDVLYADRRNL